MENQTHCNSCGGPVQLNKNKCEYCGCLVFNDIMSANQIQDVRKRISVVMKGQRLSLYNPDSFKVIRREPIMIRE